MLKRIRRVFIKPWAAIVWRRFPILACSFFFPFCCTIFSVCFWLFYLLKHTMHLCNLWPNLNYCHLFSVTNDKNWKDIKHVLIFTVTFLVNIGQQIFLLNVHLVRMIRRFEPQFIYSLQKWDFFLVSTIDTKWFEESKQEALFFKVQLCIHYIKLELRYTKQSREYITTIPWQLFLATKTSF